MATTIARVTVTRTPAGGWLITCSHPACSTQLRATTRQWADHLAAEHQRAHVAGTPSTQHEEDNY